MQVFMAQRAAAFDDAGGTTTTLLSTVSYSGAGGAAHEMTGANLANGAYSEALAYDAMARPTETSLTRVSDGALLFDSQRAYDAVGNVANVWTTLPSGTDYQAFCYDEQNRLTWASSASGTVPCGNGGTWSAGSLSSAGYTHTYTYDTLNRLTRGPGGGYTYGDSAHLDAATAITQPQGQCPSWGCSPTYTASYDAAGDMTCRAPTSATTCAGSSPTGAQLTYDNERRLASWQNAPSTPTSSTSNLYDGEGNRVAQTVTNGAATTTVMYVGAIEELSTTAGVTTTTTSYYAGGQRLAQAVNGAFSYLGSDSLGSAQVALDGSGNVQASVLYDPYGNTRYSTGTMPGTYGFTGQHADAATGLDYYNARYYDPVLGQFTSADSMAGDGLNRYAYVGGNPETATDPTGHMRDCQQFGECAPPPPPPSSGGCQSENCGGTPPPAPSPPSGCKSNCGPPPVKGGCKSNCGGSGGSDGDAFQGWWNIGVGAVGLLALGGGIAAACFGPVPIACGAAWKFAGPLIAQALRYILAGIETLHLINGGRTGDFISVLLRGAMVLADAVTIILSIANLWDAVRTFPTLLKSVAGFASATEDAFQAEQYASRIAAATSDAQRAALKAARTRLMNRVVSAYTQSFTGIVGGAFGAANIGPDVDNFLKSLQAWSASSQ